MSFGLQVFDGSGRVVMDVQDKLTRIIQTSTISSTYPAAAQGFVSVSGMTRDGTWMVMAGADIYNTFFGTVHVYVTSGGFNWYALNSYVYSTNFQAYVSVFRL